MHTLLRFSYWLTVILTPLIPKVKTGKIQVNFNYSGCLMRKSMMPVNAKMQQICDKKAAYCLQSKREP